MLKMYNVLALSGSFFLIPPSLPLIHTTTHTSHLNVKAFKRKGAQITFILPALTETLRLVLNAEFYCPDDPT